MLTNNNVSFEQLSPDVSVLLQRAEIIIQNYPTGHQAAACIPLLDLAQRQHGKQRSY